MISYIASLLNVSSFTVFTGSVVIGIGIGITALWSYIASCQTYWKRKGFVTGNSNLIKRFSGYTHIVEQEMVQKYGKLFGTYEFTKPIVFCTDPELLRDIMSKDFHMFPNRRKFPTGIDPIFDKMVFALEGDDWKRVRSIISPTFSTGKLRRMKPLIDECLMTLVNNFENIINDGKSVCDVKHVFGAFSMDVIIQVAFGTKVNSLIDEDNPIIYYARQSVSKNFNIRFALNMVFPKIAQFFNIRPFPESMSAFFKDLTLRIIEERKKQKDNVKRYDFIQLMLDAMENKDTDVKDHNEDIQIDNENIVQENENDYQKITTHNKKITNDEIASQGILFFLAGYETTTNAISFTAYCLATNPETQEKLYEEAKSAFKANNTFDYDTVHKLKYLDAVISESLRLFPAFFHARRAEQEYTLGNTGVKIPKDCIIHVPTYALHRDPDNFQDPDKFIPERFFPENRSHHPYAFLPFGAGPRNCVGMRLALMEAKLALLHSIYNFKFSTTSKTKIPPEYYKGQIALIAKDITLRIEKRSNN